MRRWLLFFSVVMSPTVAWAVYQQTPGVAIDVGGLTEELKQAVPSLEGCDDTHGVVTCRRLTGDFSPAERQAMESVVAVHDATLKARRKTVRESHRASGDAKLKALGLTDAELAAR